MRVICGFDFVAVFVQTWLTTMETMDPPALLYMLYLANDVVQHRKGSGVDVFTPEFAKVRCIKFALVGAFRPLWRFGALPTQAQ